MLSQMLSALLAACGTSAQAVSLAERVRNLEGGLSTTNLGSLERLVAELEVGAIGLAPTACVCSITGEWRYYCTTCQHEEVYSAQEASSASGTFAVNRTSDTGSWKTAAGSVGTDCSVGIKFDNGAHANGSFLDQPGCRVLTWADGSHWVRHAPSGLAAALEIARGDVIDHIDGVESRIRSAFSAIGASTGPPAGSLGAYLLDKRVYRKAAMFGLFNTTFLNEEADGGTDQETELVFQCTGLQSDADGNPALGDMTDQAMWLRDSGAQMHYYMASGLAAKSPSLMRVLQALLRQHAR